MTQAAYLMPFLFFAVVMSATPGPNNAMVLISGARVGVARTSPLILGIALGVGLQFVVLGLGLGEVFKVVPGFHTGLGIAGALYMLWLAWKLASSGPLEHNAPVRPPMGLLGGAAFQWLNPKAWTLTVSAAAAYLPAEQHSLNVCVAAVLLAVVSIPCVGLWALGGRALSQALARPGFALAFNIGMAALLLLATLPAIARLLMG